MLCSMGIKIISMCVRIILPSLHRVWFRSDDFAQSYRLSKSVTNMNPGHVKGVHDVNEVAFFWLMNLTFREVHFLSKYSHKKQWLALPIHSTFVDILILTLIILCNNVSSLSSSTRSQINFNVFSVSFGFDPRPCRLESNLRFPQTFCTT